MAELPLTQIKVDRAVLHHPLARNELDRVAWVARHEIDRGRASSPRLPYEGLRDTSGSGAVRGAGHRIRHR